MATTPVFSPGESQGQRGLVGDSCGLTESGTAEATGHDLPLRRAFISRNTALNLLKLNSLSGTDGTGSVQWVAVDICV